MENLNEIKTVIYTCSNCKFTFTKVLPSTTSPNGLGGSCPSCNITDGTTGHSLFEFVISNKNFQILME
jgi:hypothetical protein